MSVRRALVATLPPSAGGVLSMLGFALAELAARGYETTVAWYEPYSLTPRLSVPLFRLGTRRVGAEERPIAGAARGVALGAFLPELEVTQYRPTAAWRRLIAGADLHLVVSGTPMAGRAFAEHRTPFLAWLASDWRGDREARVRNHRPERRLLDRLVVRPLARRLEPRILRSGTIVALSQATRRALDRVAGSAVVREVLAPPIDTAAIRPDPAAVVPGRIGFAGRFDDPRKNLDLFLDALALARRTEPSIHAELIGRTPAAGHLEAVDRRDLAAAVVFAGELPRPAYERRLATLDALCLTSHQEGLGLAALEAMAAGVPVVATRCGGPEEFVVDGENGHLTGFAAEEIAERLVALVRDRERRARYGDAARRRVVKNYGETRAKEVFGQTLGQFEQPNKAGWWRTDENVTRTPIEGQEMRLVASIDADVLIGSPTPIGPELEPATTPWLDVRTWAQRLRRWSGIIFAFLFAQGLVQVSGLAAGFLFVNLMPVEEFAVYTLASSILVTLAFFSDLGSSSALMHFVHRSRSTGTSPEPYISAVFSLRRVLFALGAPVAVLTIGLWARQRGVNTLTVALIVALVLVAVWLQISSSLSVLRLRLEDYYSQSYRAEVGGALTKLLFAGAVAVAGWLSSTTALAAVGLGVLVTAFLARAGAQLGNVDPAAARVGRRAVLRYLAPTLPAAVYFAMQGQLLVWLTATFGDTRNLAEVGALGRLGMLVGLFSSLTGIVFVPRLLTITDERQFRYRYIQFGVVLLGVGLGLLCVAALAPDAILVLIGAQYRGLQTELQLIVATSGLGLLGGYTVAVNNARSWTRLQVGALLILVGSQISLAASLPLGSTMGALQFGLGSAVVGLLLQVGIAALGFTRPRVVQW